MIDALKLTALLARHGIGKEIAADIIDQYNKPTERIWECKIGGHVNIPEGADAPMRKAVEQAFHQLTGAHSEFTLSGWGGTLTAAKREVNDQPCHSKPRDQWCDRDGPGGFMGHTCYPNLVTERKVKTHGYGVNLDTLLDALRSYVMECDRPRGKFEAEQMYDLATAFFKGPYRNKLERLEGALTEWMVKRRPSKLNTTSARLYKAAAEYFE